MSRGASSGSRFGDRCAWARFAIKGAFTRGDPEASAMAKIRIGLVGCGFVSELHMYAYRRVYGVDVEVKAVVARGDHVVDFAGRHRIPRVYRSFSDLMADDELDVV